jgi:hypothetical protein
MTSPAELAFLVSAASAATGVAARSLLLVVAGLTAMYAKTPARRKAAADPARLLMTLPWQRATNSFWRQQSRTLTRVAPDHGQDEAQSQYSVSRAYFGHDLVAGRTRTCRPTQETAK